MYTNPQFTIIIDFTRVLPIAMILKYPRFKRTYLKISVSLLTFGTVVFIYSNKSTFFTTNKIVDTNPKKISSKLAFSFEKRIRDYENKIIPNLGHNGEPAYLEGPQVQQGEDALKKYAINTVLSDRMPLDRRLRDPRNPK